MLTQVLFCLTGSRELDDLSWITSNMGPSKRRSFSGSDTPAPTKKVKQEPQELSQVPDLNGEFPAAKFFTELWCLV